jgi:hypothetical protein
MKAITITQPYATLIAIGAKHIETRSWATNYRGPLAIHAGKGLGPVGGKLGFTELCVSSPFWEALTGAEYCGPWGRQPPRGAIVATCELVGCQIIGDPDARFGWTYIRKDNRSMRFELTDQERAFGDYTPGRYAWLLTDVKMLPEPIPAKGALSLWECEL